VSDGIAPESLGLTEQLRELLIAHAGLKKRNRVYEAGRRVQYSDSVFLSRPRMERIRTESGTVVWYAAPGRNAHVPRMINGERDEPLLDKFMRRVEKNEDGHWYWKGHCDRQGYGRFSVKIDGKYKTVGAHRWIFEYLVRPLAPGESIDHLNDICGIRNCVNIEHLDSCSPGENARRGRVKLSLANRETCNVGHPLVEVGSCIQSGTETVLCAQCNRDRTKKCEGGYFARRAIQCAEQGLNGVFCTAGHDLEISGSLTGRGKCRECARLREKEARSLGLR